MFKIYTYKLLYDILKKFLSFTLITSKIGIRLQCGVTYSWEGSRLSKSENNNSFLSSFCVLNMQKHDQQAKGKISCDAFSVKFNKRLKKSL